MGELCPAPGVFVEAGANDGYSQSNTYWLEKMHGWSGLLVEPIPELYGECTRERRRSHVLNCALVADEASEPWVTLRYAGLESRVIGTAAPWREIEPGLRINLEEEYEVTVPGRTLSSLLDEAEISQVDLLSLDIEGLEAPALMGLDLERHAPQYIVVESPGDDLSAIIAVIGDRYSYRERLSPQDVLFALES